MTDKKAEKIPAEKTKIRPLEKTDLASVLEIQTECRLSAWTLEDYQKEIERSDAIALAAEVRDEKTVGFAVVRLLLDDSKTLSETLEKSADEEKKYVSAEIYNIAVRESFQKKGVGQRIFDKIKSVLKEKNVEELWLEVRESNEQAVKFYCKNGFAEQFVRRNYYRHPTENARIFKLELNYEN